jgi:glutamate dehydrogenase (NAD(P)+)
MAGLPHGGGKSMIQGDPHAGGADKERLVRAFAQAIADLRDYIPGPDMGTNEASMGWVRDEIGRAVGLPEALGGIPLDTLGATGWGLVAAAKAAAPLCDLPLAGARVAIQGFGSVGRHAARFLTEEGAIVVAASDSRGAIQSASGLDVAALARLKEEGCSVGELEGTEALDPDDLIAIDCDIWIPAAGPDAIRADNVDRLQARMVLSGANIPATAEAEQRLHARSITLIPDFVANAGGVICGAMEYRGVGATMAFQEIADRVGNNTTSVLKAAFAEGVPPREAAHRIAAERVKSAMALTRWG